ncbi:LL-diaminopimelate aminotransferase [Oceanobacillus arenosus]|uniref:Aminotransferase n=1 Tax=Oceanobacillus arenosus TaxID=1229153 RepID=A0A3D8PN00_9BACI|nr:aminotransferase class I/II-fold pyridoxal phosphate-dependent enzyme [Oceanobacillus arenosus]RDW17354.1 LL-diaminopimelate aminotransferase [Oceanobacillus arenosus]
MHISDKVKQMPAYIFSELDRKKKVLKEKGIDVIDLGIGAPDLPTPSYIYDALVKEAKDPENHRYSNYNGCLEFRMAVADFYKKQYDVDLDPETEILTLIGSKEGIVHLIQAVINEGDKVLVPNPGYPVYRMGVHLAGGESVDLLLDQDQGFVPQFHLLSEQHLRDAKLMFLNYPSNPTTATIELATFIEAVSFAKKHHLIVAHDSAYHLVTFGNYQSPSILQVPNAKEYAVEIGSLSKSFNMTGWRIGYIVGNKAVIQALATLKSNLDSSQFLPIQKAAAVALRSDFQSVKANNMIIGARMEKLHAALINIGMQCDKPRGTIFLWAKVPSGFTSLSFTEKLRSEAAIIVTPGTAFGTVGEGYVRFALAVTMERIDETIRRLNRLELGKEIPS